MLRRVEAESPLKPVHTVVVDQRAPEDASAATPAEPSCELADEVRSWSLHEMLLATLVVFAAFYTIYFARSILFPITLAVLLNLVFKPIVLRLVRWGIPAAFSAALVLASFVAVAGVGGWMLWAPANERLNEFTSPGYLNRLAENLRPLHKPLQDLEEAGKKVDEITNPAHESTPLRVQVEQPQLGSMLNITGSFLASATIMLVLLYFLLAAGDRFLEKLVALMPTFGDRRRVVKLSREVQQRMSDYLFTISAINVVLGAAIGVGMWLIELPNPFLWGVVGGMLNFIPFAGLMIGATLVFIEGLGNFHNLAQAAAAPAIYVGLNALEANFITPALLGRSIRLNPVMIVVAIVFWGWLWGIGGVLLSVPLLVALKIFFDHSRTFAPLGVFMEQ